MQIRDIMTQNPLSATPRTTVFDAMRTLESEEIRHLPIVEDHELVGIISDRDLARFTHAAVLNEPDFGKRRLQVPVSEIMSADPFTVAPDDDVDDAIDIMLENRVSAVPVVEGTEGRLVGIVSYVDVLRAARGSLR
jgi:CBS domain-containing protein